MEKEDIIIRSAVLHILDSTVSLPVLSDTLLETGPDVNDFLRSHIYKLLSGDELKTCIFDAAESRVYELLQGFTEDKLLPVSQEMAGQLFEIMNSNAEIPAGDVFFVTFQKDSTLWLALLKMNYKEVFVHYTSLSDQDENKNEIMKQTEAIPMNGGRLSEAVIISLKEDIVYLTERRYPINGEKINYMSELFLKCHAKMSEKTKLDIVKKAVEQVNKKFYDGDLNKKMETKSILHKECKKKEEPIKVEEIAEKVFQKAPPEVKEEFEKKISKYNLPKEEIRLKSEKTTKKLEKQFLTTDSGIEINIPMEEYNNRQHVEFLTNEDGTVSVLIKNINKITSK